MYHTAVGTGQTAVLSSSSGPSTEPGVTSLYSPTLRVTPSMFAPTNVGQDYGQLNI